MMLEYIGIFILQFLFNLLKVYEIKHSYEKNTSQLIINSILMNGIALITVYYSLQMMFDGDWLVVIIYIFGAAVGKWVATTNFFKKSSS